MFSEHVQTMEQWKELIFSSLNELGLLINDVSYGSGVHSRVGARAHSGVGPEPLRDLGGNLEEPED